MPASRKALLILQGAWRSWTVWFSALLVALPLTLEIVQGSWSAFAPFVPDDREKHILQIIALIVVLLRIKTTVPLWEKKP